MDKAPAKIKEDIDSLSAKSGSLVTSFAEAAAKKPYSRPAVMSRVGWKSSQLTKGDISCSVNASQRIWLTAHTYCSIHAFPTGC